MKVAISAWGSGLYFINSNVKVINSLISRPLLFCDSCGILSFFFEWNKEFESVPVIIVSRQLPFSDSLNISSFFFLTQPLTEQLYYDFIFLSCYLFPLGPFYGILFYIDSFSSTFYFRSFVWRSQAFFLWKGTFVGKNY